MFRHPAFLIDPWQVRERHFLTRYLSHTESLFALSNGHIGLRGNLDEGEPHGIPGTYLDGVYELHPLPYAEAGYGFPESGQTVVNVTNGKIIRLLVDDEPFDVRQGTLLSHRRTLDLRTGVLTREVRWRSPAHAEVRLRSRRLVSLVQRAVAAIRYEVEAVGAPVRIVVQSELVANEPVPLPGGDPRVATALESPLVAEERDCDSSRAVLLHRVRNSGILVGAGMDHIVHGPANVAVSAAAAADVARVTMVARLAPGETLGFTKLLTYGWSSTRSRPAVHDQVVGAAVAARLSGWEGLVEEQTAYLDQFWARADVEVDGDPEVQQAVRFAMFHVLQAGARAERRPIPAKGLTGPGYDGHALWDTEIHVLGMLTFTNPEAVADVLRWRHSTLPAARARARQLGLEGAAFPWRTINGQECSAYWPAGTAAFHISADIAYAVVRYLAATGDAHFSRETGFDLLVETARLWTSLGHYDADGSYRIDGVTGPDEYSAVADNNVYTNLMAQRNLMAAAAAVGRHPQDAQRLHVSAAEPEAWRLAAERMYVPFDERLGVNPQADGFTHHQRWDFEGTRPDQYPLFLHFPYFQLYRRQVVKQADLVLAMHLRGDAFSPEQKALNFAYYEALTVRDSSLSACTQAVMAAEIGHLELAHEYVAEAALIDLDDLEHNTRDGLHIASLAGAWTAIVEGLGGLRVTEAALSFQPRLPSGLSRVRFRLLYRGRRLRVTIGGDRCHYELLDGDEVTIWHHGERVTLRKGRSFEGQIPPAPQLPTPSQPDGRQPVHRARVSPIARGARRVAGADRGKLIPDPPTTSLRRSRSAPSRRRPRS